MSIICKLFGHGSPWRKDIKYLGNSFIVEYCYCPRCGELENTSFLQRFIDMFTGSPRWIWADMKYTYNNTECFFTNVNNPDDEEFKGWNKGGGYETKQLMREMMKNNISPMSGIIP